MPETETETVTVTETKVSVRTHINNLLNQAWLESQNMMMQEDNPEGPIKDTDVTALKNIQGYLESILEVEREQSAQIRLALGRLMGTEMTAILAGLAILRKRFEEHYPDKAWLHERER